MRGEFSGYSLKSPINQYETGRAKDLLLYEPKSSGNIESHPSSGLLFTKLNKNLNTVFSLRKKKHNEDGSNDRIIAKL